METIVAAAIRIRVYDDLRQKMFKGERVYPDHLIVSAPPPARHGTLLHPMPMSLHPIPGTDQGFLTSAGRYVGRGEAWRIVQAAGQPMIDHPSRVDGVLYSEDLW